MLVGVVEDEGLALLPVADAVAHPDRELVRLVRRHLEGEMEPQHAVIGAAMGGQMLSGLEDREHRRLQPGNLPDNAPGLGAARDVALGPDPEADEKERLPVVVLGDRLDVRRDGLEGRELGLALEHAVELRPHRRHSRSISATQGNVAAS